MNRILKKAISFFSAVAIGISTLAAGAVTAQAASGVTIKQYIANKYEAVVEMGDAALFISDIEVQNEGYDYYYSIPKGASLLVLNDQGKKIKIKNTVGYDKVCVIGTGYMPLLMISSYQNNSDELLLLGKGSKYAGLLRDGTLLAKGKLFNNIRSNGTLITAVSGKTYYCYDYDGKLISKYTTDSDLLFLDYDAKTKTYLVQVSEGIGYGYETYLVRNKKIIKTFDDNSYPYGFITVGKKKYVEVWEDDGKAYYSLKGNKATDWRNIPSGNPYITDPDIPLSVDCDYNLDDRKFTQILKNTETGEAVKTYPDVGMFFYEWNKIRELGDGNYYYVSCNADCTKYGCITF